MGTDLFLFDNKNYLIIVDYYSNFWEIDYLSDTKSTTVIKTLKAHFARQGIPYIVISDNGPLYASQEFRKFSRLWEFQHKTSSPGYPQSNGKAESAVKTAKRLMLKAKAAGQDPYLALLDHRNTPSQGLETSPAQRLLSHHTKTLLPTKASLLQPEVIQAQQDLENKQKRQRAYYDRSVRDLDALSPGDCVRVQLLEPHTVWRSGRVRKPINARSYEVQLDSGGVLRRNRRHLRRAPGLAPSEPTDTETVEPSHSETEPPPAISGRHSERHTATTTGDSSTSVTTKYGRAVVKPQRYKDFVT